MAVGIAMVNYNGSDVLALTLDSLMRAQTDTSFIVCLVDNASEAKDYAQVQKSFQAFASRPGASGRDQLIRSEQNLGIGGGNNLGYRTLLKDSEIQRICFLNTDVIVTDHWLDRLLESELDMVAPVTNANGNEQTIWVDYEAARDLSAYEKAAEFGAFRARVYCGYEIECESVTTFCALIKCEMMKKVGEFDTQFFPGGFDDNDFCRRLVAAGGRIGIRRDCYVHHWGGGSFSKLKMDNRIGISFANMKRFEDKWNIVWTGTQQLLPDSLFQDMRFLLEHGITDARALSLLEDTNKAIKALLKGYETQRIEVDKRAYTTDIQKQLQVSMEAQPTQRAEETANESTDVIVVPYFPDPGGHDIAKSIVLTAGGLADNCISGVKAVYRGAKIGYHKLRAPTRRKNAYKQALDFIRDSKTSCKGTVCVLAPMYKEEKASDGYFQRINSVDQHVLKDYAKLYIENFPQASSPRIERKDDRHMVLYTGLYNPNNVNALKMLLSRSGIVYSHSLLRCMENELCSQVLRWLTGSHVKFVVDMHGAVPEEAALCDDWVGAQKYNRVEERLMAGADVMICVNHAMLEHFQKKYSYTMIKPAPVVMPIYLDEAVDVGIIDSKLSRTDYARPLVVYAGGLHKWQNIPLMQDVMEEAGDRFRYDILVSDPAEFVRMYGARKKLSHLEVRKLPPEEVFSVYRDCHYGFVLRDDIIVNNVACPTKLIEYIRFGVLPVIKTENIGDFARYGMASVSYEDFREGRIPDGEAYSRMILHNVEVLGCFTRDYRRGRGELLQLLAGKGTKA